jgi:serine/threonine-protein kinase
VLANVNRRNLSLAVVSAGTVFVLLAMLSSCVGAAFRATVPDLTNMAPAQAAHALGSAGLVPGAATYTRSSLVQSGTVAEQSPTPLERVSGGTKVGIAIAVGPTTAVVPDVRLAGRPDAERFLAGLGLSTQVIDAYSQEVPSGRVLEQLPRAGATAENDEPVVLVVSLGPGASGKSVPTVVGKSLAKAAVALDRVTLIPSAQSVPTQHVAVGTVMDQVPAPGTRVGVASRVVLAVAAQP